MVLKTVRGGPNVSRESGRGSAFGVQIVGEMTTNCLLVLFQLVFLLSEIDVEGKTIPFDRAVLDYIYKATNDRNHNLVWTNWGNSSSDPCTDNWYGITCVEDQSVYYVSVIYLPDHQLTSLPEKIVDMKHLRGLVVRGNDISAEGFPLGIFAIQTLESLDISDMHLLSITLPTRLELPNLRVLYALESQLQGYLPTTWNTPNLDSVVLKSNDLTGQLSDCLCANLPNFNALISLTICLLVQFQIAFSQCLVLVILTFI